MHQRGNYKPEDLSDVKEFRDLITGTNEILSAAIQDNDITPGMRKRLSEDIFLFSGIKAHAELFEASRQLQAADGTIKPFYKWERDVKGVKASHRKYLEAEYEFAVGTVQSAEKWESFSDSDRYLLQYRTASDDRVRDSHAVLHNVTLPKSDPFWKSYFTPNGWRCRCVTVEVLASTNEVSNSAAAILNGEKATTKLDKNGNNRLEIFRFNPGIDKVAFPPNHPYKKVAGAARATAAIEKVSKATTGANKDGFKEVKTFKNGGAVYEHVDAVFEKRDYDNVMRTATAFAKSQAAKVELLPNPHFKSEQYKTLFAGLKDTPYYGKKPDLRINGHYYEHVGFEGDNPLKRWKNMMTRGIKQSNRLILEDPGIDNDKFMLRNILTRINLYGQDIKEVWLIKDNKLRQLFKHENPKN